MVSVQLLARGGGKKWGIVTAGVVTDEMVAKLRDKSDDGVVWVSIGGAPWKVFE